MLKKAVVLAGVLLAVVGVLYGMGFRVALDGSGMWPRFVARANFSALEAHRAQQRASAPAVTAGVPSSGAPPAADSPAAPPDGVEAPPGADERESGRRVSGNWPDFRGPARDGRYTETPIRTSWPREGLPELWRQPIGLGYASWVVADGRAFTIEQRREQEVVAAYEVATGREVWTHGWPGEFTEAMGGDGPRATPTYHEGRLYALGALGELRCLDARTGSLIWRRNILSDNDAQNLSWGMAASPLVVDDKVIVLPGGPPQRGSRVGDPGGSRGRSVVAYHKMTGAPLWKSLDDMQAYVSPMLVTLAGVRQILVETADRVVGLTVEEGRLLWEYPWPTSMGINAAQPLLLGGDRVFVSASYGQGAAVFEVTAAGDTYSTRTIWQNTRMKNRFTSSVLHNGYIYGLDESILACLDAATGDLKWKGGRYGYGQVLLAGDHLIVITEDGELVLVKATPGRHEELAKFQAIEGKTWNHPVVVGGVLLVRNAEEMAAFDIRP